MTQLTNWAGNISFESRARTAAVGARAAGARRRQREGPRRSAPGTRSTRIADSTGTLVTVADLPQVIEVGDSGSDGLGRAPVRRDHGGAAVEGTRAAQPRLAAAHLGGRGVRDRYARLR